MNKKRKIGAASGRPKRRCNRWRKRFKTEHARPPTPRAKVGRRAILLPAASGLARPGDKARSSGALDILGDRVRHSLRTGVKPTSAGRARDGEYCLIHRGETVLSAESAGAAAEGLGGGVNRGDAAGSRDAGAHQVLDQAKVGDFDAPADEQ